MRKIALFLLFFCVFLTSVSVSQDDKVKVGLSDKQLQQGGAYYNYGDPDKVNIEVSVWGYTTNPGRYLIPKGTSLLDLISLSGGPKVDADLELIRIYRPKNDSLGNFKDKVLNFDYNDLLWEDKVPEKNSRSNIELQPGDILILPGSPKYFFRDNLSFVLSISSFLMSLAVLIVTLTK